MFHKRLIKEFRENQKNIWGMVLTQWVMLIANVVLMLQTATFIAGMVRGENLQNQSIRLLYKQLRYFLHIRDCAKQILF